MYLTSDLMSQTYAIFIYECGEVRWSGIDSVGHARIGISDGDNSTWIHPLSGSSSALDIDCNNAVNGFVNIILDLMTFAPAQAAASLINSSVAAPNVMVQTTGAVAQASMAATQGN